MALIPIPAKLPPALPAHPHDSSDARELLCNAFIKQLPVEWRCSRCQWRHSITVDASSPQFAEAPPENVMEAFKVHSCWSLQAR